MVVFKMRDSLPSARYSPVCNVLRQWKTSLILTYRVYRLYDIIQYILKVLDPMRKTQSRLHAEIAHAEIAVMRLLAFACVCEYILFAIEHVRVSACNRTYVRAIACACEVHLKSFK